MRAIQVIRVSKTDLQGITAYQTDYSMAALTVRASGSPCNHPTAPPSTCPWPPWRATSKVLFYPASFLHNCFLALVGTMAVEETSMYRKKSLMVVRLSNFAVHETSALQP